MNDKKRAALVCEIVDLIKTAEHFKRDCQVASFLGYDAAILSRLKSPTACRHSYESFAAIAAAQCPYLLPEFLDGSKSYLQAALEHGEESLHLYTDRIEPAPHCYMFRETEDGYLVCNPSGQVYQVSKSAYERMMQAVEDEERRKDNALAAAFDEYKNTK